MVRRESIFDSLAIRKSIVKRADRGLQIGHYQCSGKLCGCERSDDFEHSSISEMDMEVIGTPDGEVRLVDHLVCKWLGEWMVVRLRCCVFRGASVLICDQGLAHKCLI